MKNEEVIRRIKLIEKHLSGIEVQFKHVGGAEDWVTLVGNRNDYSYMMSPSMDVREKPQDIESWANVYSGYVSYHPSAARSLDVAMPSVIRIAVHMKEVK